MTKKEDSLQQKSPAEFFAENKNIAGFDNPGRCLYTTIRELVENSLDAAESANNLPEIAITIEEVSQETLNKLRGVSNHKRVDNELYGDFETQDAKKKREAKEAKELEKLEKQLAKKGENPDAIEAKKKEVQAKRAAEVSKSAVYYKINVKDNGIGMAHKDIPNMLGRALSGTKYGVKQTRGKFGLGAKMALIWSKMSTGLPIEVWSAKKNMATISYYKLDIDIQKNEPNIHAEKQVPNPDCWQGSEITVTIAGNWQYYRAKIMKYLRQIAVITPYAQFTFQYKGEDEKNSLSVTFHRRTDKMPAPPKATKHHPASVDLELIKRLIADTKYGTMWQFLSKEFSVISKEYAIRLIAEMRSGVDSETDPKEFDGKQVVRLHQLLHEAKFKEPDGNHLSPAGEYNMRLGIMKEVLPDMVATHQGDVRVFEGHPFIVEAGVSIGGQDIKSGINVYRFANRIPLLFEGGSDVITKTALKRINWGSYKMNQSSDKIGVFVSLVSTKIPFKGAGKEYIADDIEEIHQAVKHAVQQCCLQLKTKIAKQIAAREQKQRKKNLTKYIPDVASAVFKVLESMASRSASGPKRKRLEDGSDILQQVKRREVTQESLARWLTEHVEKIDTDMALEYQIQQGIAEGSRDEVYLAPLGAIHTFGPELHSTTCVITLLQPV